MQPGIEAFERRVFVSRLAGIQAEHEYVFAIKTQSHGMQDFPECE